MTSKEKLDYDNKIDEIFEMLITQHHTELSTNPKQCSHHNKNISPMQYVHSFVPLFINPDLSKEFNGISNLQSTCNICSILLIATLFKLAVNIPELLGSSRFACI